jgi:hypothetical protein
MTVAVIIAVPIVEVGAATGDSGGLSVDVAEGY